MMPTDLRAATWSAGDPAPRGPGPAARPPGAVMSGLVRTVDHGAGDVMQLSARNQIPARVTGINAGEAIANVELEANGVRLVASITVEAVRELGLADGDDDV